MTPSQPHTSILIYDDAALYEQDRAARTAPWDEKVFARTFQHEMAVVRNGVQIHYVIGGKGLALVPLHGFPQGWGEWRLVMPKYV